MRWDAVEGIKIILCLGVFSMKEYKKFDNEYRSSIMDKNCYKEYIFKGNQLYGYDIYSNIDKDEKIFEVRFILFGGKIREHSVKRLRDNSEVLTTFIYWLEIPVAQRSIFITENRSSLID